MAYELTNAFYPTYLFRNKSGSGGQQRSLNDAIYCPTDLSHRYCEEQGASYPNLIGYNYLPNPPFKPPFNRHRKRWVPPNPFAFPLLFF